MRQSGELPPQLALLAAENPLLDPVSRLERKVRRGASNTAVRLCNTSSRLNATPAGLCGFES